MFYTIRPLKFTLQPALSEKYFFQSTRTVNHNGGASIQWWTNSRCLQSNPSATTNQEHNDGRNSKIRKKLFDRIKERKCYAEVKNEEYMSCLGTQLLILCTQPVALVSSQDQLCLTSLLYNHEVAALKTCTREVTELPTLPTAIYLGNSIYLLNAADDQQFLYNITHSGGRKFSNRVPACKSCLVHPPAM